MADFDRLLTDTSRTFGLSIPLLAEPLRRQLTLAYLIFRVADTLEDADRLPAAQRLAALDGLLAALQTRSTQDCEQLSQRWLDWGPSDHAGYLDLIRALPELLSAIDALGQPAAEIILKHTGRTIEGMRGFVMLSDASGNLQLGTLNDLRRYCYVVAGIVGELITELLLVKFPSLKPSATRLHDLAVTFGEGLQLVNILRDADDDARGGRVYLPAQVNRGEIESITEADLVAAEEYVETVREANINDGVVPFLELPRQLALATLDRIGREGPGAKLSRSEVMDMVQSLKFKVQGSGRT